MQDNQGTYRTQGESHPNILITLAELNAHLANAEMLIDDIKRRVPENEISLGLGALGVVIHSHADQIENMLHAFSLCSKDFLIMVFQYDHDMSDEKRREAARVLINAVEYAGAEYVMENYVPLPHDD